MNKTLLTDIVQWDIRNWSQAIDFWDRSVDWSQVHDCLELGGRDGGLSLWLGLKGKHVVCSDIEDTRTHARGHHEKYGLTTNVDYAVVDATSIPYENQFDVVTFKSVLVAIGGGERKDRQQLAIDQIYKSLRPGGKLLFAENMVGSPLHRFVRKRFIHWGSWCRYVTPAEMREFLHRFKRVEMRTTGVLGTFGRTERQRSALSAVDHALLNHVTPAAWQYLVYGVAEK